MQNIFDVQAWKEVMVRALSEMGATLAVFVPSLVAALLILAVGWLLARTLALAAERTLRAAGLDRAASRLNVGEILERSGIEASLSQIVARLLFWLVMLTFLLSSVETLGLEAVTTTLDRLIAYIPNLIGAGLIAVLGVLAARFAGAAVGSGAAAAGVGGAARIGTLVQGAVVVLVAVIAVQQLGVSTDVLVAPLTALLATAGFAAGLAFALGAHPIITHILAGQFLKQSLPRDSFVEVEGRRGVVERIGPTDTLLRNGDERWSVPNAQLLNQIVVR